MKVHKIQLENFRCFESMVFEFSSNFNVVIGDNGSGKTALLHGLCVAISSIFLGIDGVNSRSINRNDVRLVNYGNNIEYQYPSEIICLATVWGEKTEWSRSREGRSKKTKLQNIQIKKMSQKYQKEVRQGKNVDLPVIAYFPARRIWELPMDLELVEKGSRFRGYDKAIMPTSNYKFFINWFKTKELAALQNRQDFFKLKVVKKAVSNCIDTCEDIFYGIDNSALVMKFSDGKILPFNRLSDGFKNMMAVVSDIAYRCVTLNPHLETDALNSLGTILIDELDLHLHPSWQKKVITDLKRTFPNLQFIAATHSPLVLRSMKNDDKIILLEYDKLVLFR